MIHNKVPQLHTSKFLNSRLVLYVRCAILMVFHASQQWANIQTFAIKRTDIISFLCYTAVVVFDYNYFMHIITDEFVSERGEKFTNAVAFGNSWEVATGHARVS